MIFGAAGCAARRNMNEIRHRLRRFTSNQPLSYVMRPERKGFMPFFSFL
ncbi:hypothetical protein HMPREF1548_00394 [Clostridium sp. KLE 1755]|nr:hypothetical protein HMPREF1548_00394 [Clostridium sp. KLE 1755]